MTIDANYTRLFSHLSVLHKLRLQVTYRQYGRLHEHYLLTFRNSCSDHVSYKVPRPTHRPMHRSIYRSLLDRPSTNTRPACRSTIDRESTDVFIELPLMSAEVSTVTISGAYPSTIGGISVKMSVVYHSIVERESTDTICRSIERYYL